MTSAKPALAIVGPTAAGKSAVALELAARDPRIEIVSADSMQIYRGMDIGTAKPTLAEQAAVRHHLIDIADPHEQFTVSQFADAAARAVSRAVDGGGIPIIVGGTGLYVRALLDDLDIPGQFADVRRELEDDPDTGSLHRRLSELDPLAASRMEPSNRRRIVRALEVTLGSGRPFSDYGPGLAEYPPSQTVQIGCDRPRESLDARIDRRYDEQMSAGFLDEIRALAALTPPLSKTARQALGYKELLAHVEGDVSLDDALDLAKRRTRRFARRQQRWFRRDPRIEWFDLDATTVDSVLDRCVAAIG